MRSQRNQLKTRLINLRHEKNSMEAQHQKEIAHLESIIQKRSEECNESNESMKNLSEKFNNLKLAYNAKCAILKKMDKNMIKFKIANEKLRRDSNRIKPDIDIQ